MAKTMFDKIWDAHEVAEGLLYIDLHLVHEVTSPQAFDGLRLAGRRVRRPDRTLATADHNVPTDGSTVAAQIADRLSRVQVETLERNCREFGVPVYSIGSKHQGIVHVIGPELGVTQPGMTVVWGDSHTATHGAFGALAFGIGTSEVGYVLATQCLLQRKAKTLNVRVEGRLGPGVTAKDVILAVIARIGVGGGTGHVIEYTGPAIRALSMEARMTVCNMSIEAGARAGLIAPDDTTYQWLAGRRKVPQGKAWDDAVAAWRKLPSDEGARYDRTVTRRTLVVPGSHEVKQAAEAEGLDRIFKDAGAEWREPGCSMCIAMNGDQLKPGQSAVSTSNRNFEGRQGPGGRTFLASPLTAAASAVTGALADVRELLARP